MYQLIHRNFASQICIFSNTKSYISKSILKIKMQHSKHLFKNKPRGSLILCPFLFPSNGKCFKKTAPNNYPKTTPNHLHTPKKHRARQKRVFSDGFFCEKPSRLFDIISSQRFQTPPSPVTTGRGGC